MDPSLLRLVAEDGPVGRSVTLDTTSEETIEPDLVSNGCDLQVEEIPEGQKKKPLKEAFVVPAPSAGGGVGGGAGTRGQDSAEISASVRKVTTGCVFQCGGVSGGAVHYCMGEVQFRNQCYCNTGVVVLCLHRHMCVIFAPLKKNGIIVFSFFFLPLIDPSLSFLLLFFFAGMLM